MNYLFSRPSSTKESVLSNSDLEYFAAEKYGKEQNNCNVLFPGCNVDLIEVFTRIL